jgi:hypothetical protein
LALLSGSLYFGITQFMAKSIVVTPKKRGRPATGRDPVMTVRLPEELIGRLKAYAKRNNQTRSEALRELIERSLKREK